jgi:hypothetical protein
MIEACGICDDFRSQPQVGLEVDIKIAIIDRQNAALGARCKAFTIWRVEIQATSLRRADGVPMRPVVSEKATAPALPKLACDFAKSSKDIDPRAVV